MIKSTILAAAATLTVLTAGVASAEPNAEMPSAKTNAARYAISYDRKHRWYCLRDRQATPPTGSRMILPECKTSEDWAQEGLIIGRKR